MKEVFGGNTFVFSRSPVQNVEGLYIFYPKARDLQGWLCKRVLKSQYIVLDCIAIGLQTNSPNMKSIIFRHV